MGSFSIWHWIIVAVVLAVPLALIASVESEARLTRRPFAVRLLGLMGVTIVLGMLVTILPQEIGVVFGLLMIPVLLISIWSIRWSAARFQDMGLSKWLALLYWVPFANFLVLLCQCLAGTRVQASTR